MKKKEKIRKLNKKIWKKKGKKKRKGKVKVKKKKGEESLWIIVIIHSVLCMEKQ
jgi:hypothetical protein